MRRLLLAMMPMLLGTLLGTQMPAADLTIDHVTVAGRDLKSMQARLASIGIRSEYGGPHSNHATEMALTSFPDGSYLELIAIQPDADPKAVAAHYWSPQMQGNAGPSAWAVRANNLAAELGRLKHAGVAVSEPVRSGRQRPDGVRLEWESANVGTEPNGTFFPFLIHDFTPREKRAFPGGKPVTQDFSGVARVVIAVRDLQASVARYRKAYGLPEPAEQLDPVLGARLAGFSNTPKGTPVVLAAPLNAQSWLAERLNEFGEGPCAFILRSRNASGHPTASKSKWFGTEISWFDAAKLGWRLGQE
jgi:catechol 2,3-dioxygenase-like lactoylglutathione lyase family enzyme